MRVIVVCNDISSLCISEHVDDIVTLIFQYINMLKKEGPQDWVFQESRDLRSMMFHFKDKQDPYFYTQSTSFDLQVVVSVCACACVCACWQVSPFMLVCVF